MPALRGETEEDMTSGANRDGAGGGIRRDGVFEQTVGSLATGPRAAPLERGAMVRATEARTADHGDPADGAEGGIGGQRDGGVDAGRPDWLRP